jgi:hypothetical protein
MPLTGSLMTRHDRTANSSAIAMGGVAQLAGESSGFRF